MSDVSEIKNEIMQFAYDCSAREHEELSDTWKLLDTKAQATAAIAGVFVAAAFAFVRNTSLNVGPTEKWLLSLALLFLTASILCAVLAMVVRPISMPLSGADAAKSVGDVLRQSESELPERQTNLIADAVTQWAGVNDEIRNALVSKGKRVEQSQAALVAATLIVTSLTIVAIHFGK